MHKVNFVSYQGNQSYLESFIVSFSYKDVTKLGWHCVCYLHNCCILSKKNDLKIQGTQHQGFLGGRKGTLTLWFRICINFLYHLVGSYNYSRAKNEEGFVCKHYDWPCQELFTANLCCDSNRSSV